MKLKNREDQKRKREQWRLDAERWQERQQWMQRTIGIWRAGPFVARMLGFRPGIRWPRWWFWPLTLLGGSAVVLGVGWLLNLVG